MLEKLFAQKVFALLLQTKKITPWVREQMRGWKHSGFSVDASVRVLSGDKEGLFRLLRYMARAAVAKDRLAYDRQSGQVTLFSAHDRAQEVATYNALEFLALLSLQVPPKGSHLIRYSGYYASRSRFLRGKNPQPLPTAMIADSPGKRERRKKWAELIRQVFEVDPLRCRACGNQMRLVSFVMKATEIQAILHQMQIPCEETRPRGPPGWFLALQASQWIEQNPHLYPPEEDLPQAGPTLEDYHYDPIFTDERA